MDFTNEEIEKYLLERVNKETALKAKCLSEEGNEIDITTGIKIDAIVFDEEENISITFLECQTSIFIYDEEFMFIDEKSRESYTFSDVWYRKIHIKDIVIMSRICLLLMLKINIVLERQRYTKILQLITKSILPGIGMNQS